MRDDNEFGEELWTTDLTPQGTMPLADHVGGSAAGPVTLHFRGGRNDNVVTGSEDDGPIAFSTTVTLDSVTSTTAVDLSPYLEPLRELFARGYRTITVIAEIDEGVATIEPIGGSAAGTALLIGGVGGVRGQLVDAEGRLIASHFTSFDLRNLPAGEYVLGISAVDAGAEATAYRAELEIPLLASAHTETHDDRLSGGDGDDVVFAGPGRDGLLGDSGADVLVGEPFEFLQRDPEDTLRSSLKEHRYADSLSPRRLRDPAIAIGPADDSWGSYRTGIENPELAIAIGEHLGVSVQHYPDGTLAYTELVTASDLAEIIELDLSARGLTELPGIEHLVGLRTLDLSDNDLSSSALQRLRPAAAGNAGLQRIEHLNLDRNRVTGLGHLGQLSTLRALSLADQSGAGVPGVVALSTLAELRYLNVSGNQVSSLDPLANLSDLRILDASGDIFAQQGLNQIDLRSFTGTQAYDASIFAAETGWRVHTDIAATGGSYLVLDTVTANPDAKLKWEGVELKPGQYEVYAAWHGDASHHAEAIYSINDEELARVDQRLPSRGRSFGDRQVQQIGMYESDGDQVEIELRAGAGDGLLIADVLVLRPTAGAALDHLLHLDLRGTALSDTQRGLLLGDFEARGGVLHVDPVVAPQWTGPKVLAVPAGNTIAVDDLNTFFSNQGGGVLQFAAGSDSASVTVGVDGNSLKIDTEDPVERLVHLSITATNSEELATTAVLPIAVGFGAVEGRVTDVGGQPVEGVRLSGDNPSGPDFTATTDAEGRYVLLVRGEGTIVAGENANLSALAPVSNSGYDVRPGEVVGPLDFEITRGLQFSLPPSVQEGETVSLDIENVVAGEYQWSISGGPFEFSGDRGEPSSAFTPRDAGIYTVTAELRSGGERYVLALPLVVEEVVAKVAPLSPWTIEEGRFRETLTLIEDGGNDAWDVRIDFGNGESVKLLGTESREYDFDVAYPEAGLYTIHVTVADGTDAVSEGNFVIKVVETVPQLESEVIVPFIQGDDSGRLRLAIDDPAGNLNPYTWSFEMDWGDGSALQDVGHLLELQATPGSGWLTISHNYAVDGSFEPRLRVIDNDGDSFEVVTTVTVANDSPQIALEIPAPIIEDTEFAVSSEVEDSDATTIVWDFGDGSASRRGTQATHRFARSGDYTITVTATDSDGAVTVTTASVTVLPVNDPPSVTPIPPQLVSEENAFSWQVNAVDEDGDALVYELRDAPAGMTVDTEGLLVWTPTAQQGPDNYQFTVAVSDEDSTVLVPVEIDVLDTGSIEGRLFVDANANGRWDSGELPLVDSTVRLDAGNDGVIDDQMQTQADGQFRFAALPLGTYRVIAESEEGFDFTTPSQLLIDLTVPEPVVLPGFGGLLDSDGDGLTNTEERSTAAGLDGNGDGVPDWLQSNVASLEVGAGVITIAADAGTRLSELVADAAHEDSPTGTAIPWGRVNFEMEGLAPGGRARIELSFTPEAGINAVYQVDDSAEADTFFRLLGTGENESMDVENDRLLLSLRDGGDADLDAIVDGRTRHSWQFAEQDRVWTNPLEPLDANGDGQITPRDALLIINELNRRQGRFQLTEDRPPDADYFDVNGDGWVTPVDALRVINELNRRGGTGTGEGEPPAGPSSAPSASAGPTAAEDDPWKWID